MTHSLTIEFIGSPNKDNYDFIRQVYQKSSGESDAMTC